MLHSVEAQGQQERGCDAERRPGAESDANRARSSAFSSGVWTLERDLLHAFRLARGRLVNLLHLCLILVIFRSRAVPDGSRQPRFLHPGRGPLAQPPE